MPLSNLRFNHSLTYTNKTLYPKFPQKISRIKGIRQIKYLKIDLKNEINRVKKLKNIYKKLSQKKKKIRKKPKLKIPKKVK